MRLQLCFFFWYVTVRFSLALILIRYGHQLTETCSFWSHAPTFKRTANFNLDAFQWSISSIDRPRIFLLNNPIQRWLDDCFEIYLRARARERGISIIRSLYALKKKISKARSEKSSIRQDNSSGIITGRQRARFLLRCYFVQK